MPVFDSNQDLHTAFSELAYFSEKLGNKLRTDSIGVRGEFMRKLLAESRQWSEEGHKWVKKMKDVFQTNLRIPALLKPEPLTLGDLCITTDVADMHTPIDPTPYRVAVRVVEKMVGDAEMFFKPEFIHPLYQQAITDVFNEETIFAASLGVTYVPLTAEKRNDMVLAVKGHKLAALLPGK